MIWTIRVDRDKKTNEIKRVKVIDMDNFKTDVVSSSLIKKVLKEVPNCIVNLYLDKYDKLRLREMSPYSKSKAYKTVETPFFKIQQFCIITNYNNGSISWIIDKSGFGNSSDFEYIEDSTVDRLLESVGEDDITNFKLYNGYFGTTNLFLFEGYRPDGKPGFRVAGDLITKHNPKTISFDNTWEVSYGVDAYHLDLLDSLDGKVTYKIPEGIEGIEEFGGGVNNLILPDSLNYLGEECFSGIQDLYTLRIGNGLKYIPENCFYDCSIERVHFGTNTKIISKSAFESTNLKGTLILNAEVIEDCAFSQTNISKINLLGTKIIGKCAFEMNDKLTDIKFGDKLEVIHAGAFRYCSKLQSIYIPDSCKYIGKQAFANTHLRIASLPRTTRVLDGAIPKRCKVVYRD